MTTEKLARVGDVIEEGQCIPANVVEMVGERPSGSQATVTRVIEADLSRCWSNGRMATWDDGDIPDHLYPLTVVDVDPEPQPAKPVEQCDECEGNGVNCFHHRAPRPAGLAPADDPDHPIGVVVGHLNMAIGVLGSARRRITGDYVSPERKLDPLPPLDDAISRVKDARALLTGDDQPAASAPLVLTLPEVPAEAVALVGGRTGRRYPVGPELSLAVVLGAEGSVTVEFAPPREPRTWPKHDLADVADLPPAVTVMRESGIAERWDIDLQSGRYRIESNPVPLTLAELTTLGKVTEVFD